MKILHTSPRAIIALGLVGLASAFSVLAEEPAPTVAYTYERLLAISAEGEDSETYALVAKKQPNGDLAGLELRIIEGGAVQADKTRHISAESLTAGKPNVLLQKDGRDIFSMNGYSFTASPPATPAVPFSLQFGGLIQIRYLYNGIKKSYSDRNFWLLADHVSENGETKVQWSIWWNGKKFSEMRFTEKTLLGKQIGLENAYLKNSDETKFTKLLAESEKPSEQKAWDAQIVGQIKTAIETLRLSLASSTQP